MCYMGRSAARSATVGVRELRQNLSIYLDRVKKGEALTVTEHGKSDQGPQRRVSVLPAVLSHARHVTLDIARIQLAFVEWRCKENYQAIATAYQVFFDGGHRALRSIAFSGARDH